MAFDYIADPAVNLVRTSGNVFSSSSEDTNYPHENIAAGWPAKPFKFNAAAADDQITVDFTSAKAVTFCSVHGHNIDSGISAIQLRKSSDNFSASDDLVATMTKATPTFFTSFASTSFRYWRLKFVGTNTASPAPIAIGEWVLGVKATLSDPKLVSYSYEDIMPQSRQTGKDIPQVFAVNLADLRQRSCSLTFVAKSYAGRDELRDNLLVASKFGQEPLIFVPDANDSIVIHGRMPDSIKWKSRTGGGTSGGLHETTFTIEEDPFSVTLP